MRYRQYKLIKVSGNQAITKHIINFLVVSKKTRKAEKLSADNGRNLRFSVTVDGSKENGYILAGFITMDRGGRYYGRQREEKLWLNK